jgi:hypothetical protein
MGGQQEYLCRNFLVACEASGAREHVHDSKDEASSGRTNNARKGVDESVWAVQLVEHADRKVVGAKRSCWKKAEAGRSTGPLRPVGPGRPAGLPYLRSPRLSFSTGKLPSPSSICVFKFVCPKPP